MQRITADLRRLALSGAATCAVLTVAYHETTQHRGPLSDARAGISAPIMVRAMSLAVSPLCRTPSEWISVSGVEVDPISTSQVCANALPTRRRSRELALESQSALALR
jgi:hypothetical protein